MTDTTLRRRPGCPAWHRVQVQVVPTKWALAGREDAWSNVVELRGARRPSGSRRPRRRRPRAAGVATVGWRPVPGATSYAVQGRPSRPARRLARRRHDVLGTVGDGRGTCSTGAGYVFRVRAERGELASAWSRRDARSRVPALAAVDRVRVTATAARRPGHALRPVAAGDVVHASGGDRGAVRAGAPPRRRRFERRRGRADPTVKRFGSSASGGLGALGGRARGGRG